MTNATKVTIIGSNGNPAQVTADGELLVDAEFSGTISTTPLVASSATYNQVSVTTGATAILAANATRAGASITNPGPSVVYIGTTNAVTTGTGTPLGAGASYIIDSPIWEGGVWGIVASSTQTVSYIDYTI